MSYGDEKYGIGNIVHNTVIMFYGDCTYCGELWVTYRIDESIYCKPETNRKLYINYNLINISYNVETNHGIV